MSKKPAKRKARAKKKASDLPAKSLNASQAKSVVGGLTARKAGKGPEEYF